MLHASSSSNYIKANFPLMDSNRDPRAQTEWKDWEETNLKGGDGGERRERQAMK